MDFAQFLAPFDPAAFRAQYCGKQPLYVRGEASEQLKNVVPGEGDFGSGVAKQKVEYSADLITADALQFIRNQASNRVQRPFFLYYAPTLPHANNEARKQGMEVPELGEYAQRDWPAPQRAHAAMITRLDFSVVKVEFDLECGVPVRGCLGIPDGPFKGLILLGHGMASTPERCFDDADKDYMNALGKQLCQDGYVVWCSYIVQIGKQESQNNIAAMLASHGVSAHNVSCASIDAGETVCGKLTGAAGLNVGVYGVSSGVFLALHLEAATGRMRPTVVSGYMRDEKKFLMSSAISKNLGIEIAAYIHFANSRAKYTGAELAYLLCPCPLFVEIGSRDAANAVELGRDEKFAEMRSVYASSAHPHLIDMDIFDGGHEASGKRAWPWLYGHLASPAYQETLRLKNPISS